MNSSKNRFIEKQMRILYQENQPNIEDISLDEENKNLLITLRGQKVANMKIIFMK